MLSKSMILDLFAALDTELARKSIRGDVFVVGGAAMSVAYDARPSTRDVDAIWHPSAVIRTAAKRVASQFDDVDPDWLNDAVKGFFPPKEDGMQRVVYEGESLTVSAASPEYLLAMKLMASRTGRDEDDILFLCGLCEVSRPAQGFALLERYFPDVPVQPKVQFLLEELLKR